MSSRELKERGWRPSALQLGLGLGGLGGLIYGSHKAYKAYDKYNLIKEAAAAMNASSSPIYDLTMEAL